MADKQTGTGARGKQNQSEGQNKTERGNHTGTSADNRSKQIRNNNRSTDKVDVNRNTSRR
jgi:hypothetical protein